MCWKRTDVALVWTDTQTDTEYALINRARGPHDEIFVLTFKAHGPHCVRSKYFPYGPKSRLIRALLYTYANKVAYDEILLS